MPRSGALTGSEPMELFENDDQGFRTWLYANIAGGYVVYAQRGTSPGQPILRRATCETITPAPDKSRTGGFVKVCSRDRFELEQRARDRDRCALRLLRPRGSELPAHHTDSA